MGLVCEIECVVVSAYSWEKLELSLLLFLATKGFICSATCVDVRLTPLIFLWIYHKLMVMWLKNKDTSFCLIYRLIKVVVLFLFLSLSSVCLFSSTFGV